MDDPDTPHPPKKRSIRKTTPKKKTLPIFTLVNRPGGRYAIQRALVKRGLYLVNPATYKYINGFLNVSAIYLTFVPPPLPHNGGYCALGFLPQDTPQKVKDDQPPKELKIDATLYFSYPTEEYFLGLGEDGIFYVVIQTWHDAEIEKWDKIAQEVALELSTNEDESITQTVKFYITSTFLPNDPNASHQLIIKPRSQLVTDAISYVGLKLYEEDFYDV